MTLIYVAKLGLTAQTTNVSIQKIDGSILETYKIMIASFLL